MEQRYEPKTPRPEYIGREKQKGAEAEMRRGRKSKDKETERKEGQKEAGGTRGN